MVAGKRIVVVGASAGIGRAFGVRAVAAGADVVLAARRLDALSAAVAEAGGGTALALDVCDPASRTAFVTRLADGPPVDLVLCCVGVADLRPLAATDDERWATTMATNVTGVARLIEGLLPVLAPEAVLAVLSSETGRRPRAGLVPYAASKAALDTLLAGCRIEHPERRVSCVVVGATYPTAFGDSFQEEHLVPAMDDWQRHGQLQQRFMTPDDVAGVLVGLYGTALQFPEVALEEVVLRSPSPVLGTPEPA